MTTLVTGGAGFIGSHLVEDLIEKNHNVIVVDISRANIERNLSSIKSKNLTVINKDIRELDEKDCGDVDVVFHLAALADVVPSIERPYEYHDVNVNGTVNVLEFSRKKKVQKFVYAASSSCYGNMPKLPMQESADMNPMYPYALTKYIGEQYVSHWHKVYGLPTISLRLFNVYGPRSRTTGTYGAVFGVFLAQKIGKKPYTIVGDGNQGRDFIFVKDVAEAFILAATSSFEGKIYNIGSGSFTTINSLVDLLGRDHGVVHVPDRPGEPKTTMAWIDKAQTDLKFMPKVDMRKGVGLMLENISYWAEAPLWDKSSIEKATKNWFKYMGENKVGT